MVPYSFEGCDEVILVFNDVLGWVGDSVIVGSDEDTRKTVAVEGVRAVGFNVYFVVDCSCVVWMEIERWVINLTPFGDTILSSCNPSDCGE